MAVPTLQPPGPATLRLGFPPDLSSARAAAATVRTFLAAQGVSGEDVFACELCVAEACNNAVEYASGARGGDPAVVDVSCSDGGLELRISDHTAGFRWPKHFAAMPVQAERGRGLFIIHSFMDEVRYECAAQENVLIMGRRRRGRSAAGTADEAAAVADGNPGQLAECERAISAMARALCIRSETLSAVFHCCAELGRSGASEGFEERLLADMLNLTAADWYVLRLVSPDRHRLVVTAVSSPELNAGPLAISEGGGAPASLEARVAATRAAERFDARACPLAEPLRAAGEKANGVVYPLYFSDALVGTVTVGRRQGDFAFGGLHEEVGRTFADFLAIQTAGFRHRAEDLNTKLYARELDIARVIQRSLLRVTLPQVPGFGLAGGWHSAREVGGDFYDAVALSEHGMLLMVADVMGKGVPAALIATNLRGLLRGLSARFDDPAQLLGRLNRLLYEELSAVNMFFTAQVAVVDVRTRTVTAAGAGHCPMLYVTDDGVTIEPLATQGMPLGMLPDLEYRSRTVTLGRPGTLLLYTDGLTDMRNAAGQTFGQDRLAGWLGANHGRGRSATELRGRLAAELTRYRGETAMVDDQAFLLLTEECAEAEPGEILRFQPPRAARGAAGSAAG